MIISHKHKFIFLKTRKTAGTSIEIALSKYCGRRDVITRVGEEQLRSDLGYTTAQNYSIPFSNWKLSDFKTLIIKRRFPRFDKHMPAERVKERVGSDTWQQYFKFCVERNPFDKAISLFFWRTRGKAVRPTLLEFLQLIDEESLSNFHIYGSGSRVEVNHVIRYEELEKELNAICVRLGIGPLELPRAKGGIRRDPRSYRDLMREEERAIVERVCTREIELLGYKF